MGHLFSSRPGIITNAHEVIYIFRFGEAQAL
jgi:hypothetical protein